MGKRVTWDVRGIDVWGNARDGWEQNDYYRLGTVEMPEWPLSEQVIKALREAGFIKRGIKSTSMGIEVNEGLIEVTDERRPRLSAGYGHSKPEFQLVIKQ